MNDREIVDFQPAHPSLELRYINIAGKDSTTIKFGAETLTVKFAMLVPKE